MGSQNLRCLILLLSLYLSLYIYIQKTTQYGPQFLRFQFSGVFHVLGKDISTLNAYVSHTCDNVFFIHSH